MSNVIKKTEEAVAAAVTAAKKRRAGGRKAQADKQEANSAPNKLSAALIKKMVGTAPKTVK